MAKIHFRPYTTKQILLFPQRIDENIAEDDPVRLVNGLIDQLDLTSFRKLYKAAGRSPFHPRMMLKAVIYGYIELDEADQRRNFKKDLESGEFNPEEYIEDSEWYDEVPTDEDELFNLWEEWESDQFSSCDVAWALARYPDLPDHMDLEDNQDYICFIPDAFNS